MKSIFRPIDLNKVRTIVYHLPDGQRFAIRVEEIRGVIDFGIGDVCDTSEIDGVLHFFPRGNA